jgi:hypothetical protein
LKKKFHEIDFMLKIHLFDILIINETKLVLKADSNLLVTNNYSLIRRDRLTNGGGRVMVFVKLNLKHFGIVIDEKSNNEIISFILKIDSKKLGIIAGYRPPHISNAEDFFAVTSSIIENLDMTWRDDIIVAGDLNFDCFDQVKSEKLCSFMSEHGLNNTIVRVLGIMEPTALCDITLCLFTAFFISSAVFPFPTSDHHLAVSIFNYKSERNKSQLIQSRSINADNLKLIRDKIEDYFEHVDNTRLKCVYALNTEIKNNIIYCRDCIAPLKSYNVKPENKTPWLTKH